jgi:hypothetical protein
MYDIAFISYGETYADHNWDLLKSKFPTAKRVDGVKGIHQAHIKAAKKCFTKMFWVVDADAQLVDDFNFDYEVDAWNLETVHVWRSINPVNGLEYGNGGVKLLPRKLTLKMDLTKPDMTTSISDKFKVVERISNVTAFNTDEYSTWRSAFRECAKLASKTIDRQDEDETNERLRVWQTARSNSPYGSYAIKGAQEGSSYGRANQNNTEALKQINDYDWLYEQFSKHTLG